MGSILVFFGDNFGLRVFLENLRLPLEKLNLQFRLLLQNLVFRSILLASGSGWAGGVTRSAKNLFAAMWDISVPCPRLLRIRPGGMREARRT